MIVKKATRGMIVLHSAAILMLGTQAAYASNVGVDVNINLGVPPRQVVVAPEPVYAPAPPPMPAQVVIEPDVQFIYPDRLGFYVAVGVPYDLVYAGNSYFMFRDGRWLRATSCRGPWVEQRYRDLPPMLRRHRLERIREYRDREYVVYRRDMDHYRGRHFRGDRDDWKEHRKEERRFAKEQRKEERRFEKEQRKEEKRFEKEQRKEDKRFEKEERREHRGRGEY